MAHDLTPPSADTLDAASIESYLQAQDDKGLLRFITCGSVDDGKSTLIGRLLYETKLIFEDQLKTLEAESKKLGTQGEKLDFALLVDGLSAEREQGITIDVAYRFFASTADTAVILIDARKGVLTQTRRHSRIASMVGIRHIAVAINKMDLVDYDRDVFESIAEEYRAAVAEHGFDSITCIPLSALDGDNVIERSERMPWYDGGSLLEFLETVQVGSGAAQRPLRMAVQWVNRPNLDFRGLAGRIAREV